MKNILEKTGLCFLKHETYAKLLLTGRSHETHSVSTGLIKKGPMMFLERQQVNLLWRGETKDDKSYNTVWCTL